MKEEGRWVETRAGTGAGTGTGTGTGTWASRGTGTGSQGGIHGLCWGSIFQFFTLIKLKFIRRAYEACKWSSKRAKGGGVVVSFVPAYATLAGLPGLPGQPVSQSVRQSRSLSVTAY